jgi:hypothetical protein
MRRRPHGGRETPRSYMLMPLARTLLKHGVQLDIVLHEGTFARPPARLGTAGW